MRREFHPVGQLREICYNDWQWLSWMRDTKKRPVFNSFLLGGRERWLASAYQTMSETIELIMQKDTTQGGNSHAEGPGREACGSTQPPKEQVNTMLGEMVEDLGKHLKKGARIRISGLGILQVRKRPARMGRNPATGEAIKIKASKKIAFRASKDLKEMVM